MSGFCTGTGYDIHKLVEGRILVLAGVVIPFDRGFLGHSDGDILSHAICDAMLGAAAMGDIGQHFPDSDDRYRGADSLTLLAKVAELVDKHGFQIQNVDATVIIEKPKLAPYISEIRANLAKVLRLDLGSVSVKAKSNEGLGEIGSGQAAVAQAVCLLRRVDSENS